MTTRQSLGVCLLAAAVAGAYTIWAMPGLPDRLPIHWTLGGRPDGFASRDVAVALPLVTMGLIVLLLTVVPRLGRGGAFDVGRFRPTYNRLLTIVAVALAGFHVAALHASLWGDGSLGRGAGAAGLVAFAMLANLLGKTRRNRWVGIRTPWTLASDANWIATHRLAARLLTGACLVAAAAVAAGAPAGVIVGLVGFALLYPAVYSFVLSRRARAVVVLFVVSLVYSPLASADVSTAPALGETQVDFVGAGGLSLHGTLLVPATVTGATRGPAVLLLPGSGPTDRDGNQPPYFVTNTLKQMAEALSRHGVVTLRFDKRAAAVHAADWPKGVAAQNAFFAWDRFVGDADAAMTFLRGQPAVDPARVAILGHSEGGLIALQLAHDSATKPAALILVGTAGRDLGTVIVEQLTYQLKAGGADDATARPLLDGARRAIEQVRRDSTVPKGLPPALAALFPANAVNLLHAYFTIDPVALAASYGGPVLILQGERDVQVSADRDAPLLAEALRKRPAPAGPCELVIVPNASHNLKPVKLVGDPGIAGPVSGEAIEKLVAWGTANLTR